MEPIDRNSIPEFRLRRMLALEAQEAEQQQKLQPIRDKFGPRDTILEILALGDEYQFVHHRYRFNDERREAWAVFVRYEDQHRACSTLDQAVLTALAHKYEGRNSHAATYMAKMLGMPDA